jgi:hypothetical protein
MSCNINHKKNDAARWHGARYTCKRNIVGADLIRLCNGLKSAKLHPPGNSAVILKIL